MGRGGGGERAEVRGSESVFCGESPREVLPPPPPFCPLENPVTSLNLRRF